MMHMLRCILLCCLAVDVVQAGSSLRVITDAWPPNAYEEGGEVVGSDVDVVRAVFAQLGLTANIEILPWKRCITTMENKQADAILAISHTEERTAFLHYPSEPVSYGQTVFFSKSDSAIDEIDLNNKSQLKVGAILGYKYCQELDHSPLIQEASRVSTLEQNFRKLMLGRIDLLVEVDAVGLFTSKELGLEGQIEIVPNARYCQGGNFLAFSKQARLASVNAQFDAALQAFKKSARYQEIMQRYGLK